MIEIRDVRKRYGDTRALDGLDLAARPGEVLGVAGPNGAGKSTLLRILAGEETADSGEILLNGAPFTATDTVAVVHQEPQLFPNLSVADNLLVGRERGRFLRPRLRRDERALMDELAISGSARRPLELCTLATQQRTEIARALARDARIFLFDEPNSALTDEESNELFSEMRALAARGRIVLLVSHRLADLVAHSARVAIIRDGRVATVLEGDALTQEAIAQELVIAEEVAARERQAAAAEAAHGEELLRLGGWTHAGGEFAEVDLALRAGDVVALVGVEGSGTRELLRSVAALERASGTVEIAGSAGRAATDLTAYVPATRQLSLFSNLTVGENVVVRLDREIADGGIVLRRRRMRRLAGSMRDRFMIKARSLGQGIRALSGGNQQKVAIAQALAKRPRVLLLEEPTRGVDIQSRQEIYRLLRDYALDGNAVLMYCTEVPEVFESADRVYVVSDGRLSEPLEVAAYERVEVLARDISRFERHGSATAA
jgi:ABC-type sugar transport system ATPase subunit